MMLLVCSNVCGITPTLFNNIFNDRMTYDEQHTAIRSIINMDSNGTNEFKTMIDSKLYPQERICLDFLNGKYRRLVVMNLDDDTVDVYDSFTFSGIT